MTAAVAKAVAEGVTDVEWLVTDEDLARKELPTAEERTADQLQKVRPPLFKMQRGSFHTGRDYVSVFGCVPTCMSSGWLGWLGR